MMEDWVIIPSFQYSIIPICERSELNSIMVFNLLHEGSSPGLISGLQGRFVQKRSGPVFLIKTML